MWEYAPDAGSALNLAWPTVDWQPWMTSPTVQMPQRFGRYVLLDRMGVGGMAEVYRAVVPGVEGFKRDLVVKKILTAQARAQNFIDMFVHEARISALLHHPNVVQVFDFGQVDGNYFLAMELLRGRDLLAVLRTLRERKRQMPIPVATHIAHQVALGLGYAHALTTPTGEPLNIIHRDVSPSNIMCLRAGGVKLLDFGIAQAIGEMEASESGPDAGFKGKLGYMAPERLLNRPQDHRVDLFALGTVMWEMLTGRRLFYGKSDEEKMSLLLEKAIPPPSSVRSEVPPALDAIVARALERDPEQRYASGQIMADDLEMVLPDVKYHSRMLPALLVELFGSSPSAAHMAMSLIPPELLVVEATPSAPPVPARATASEDGPTPAQTNAGATPADAATITATATTSPGPAIRSKKVMLVVAAATMVAIAGVGAALAARTSSESTWQRTSAAGVPVARPALVVDPPAPEPAIVNPTTTPSADGLEDSSSSTAPKPLRQPAARRAAPGRITGKVSSGRITRGLSIDPFAEAAAPRVKK